MWGGLRWRGDLPANRNQPQDSAARLPLPGPRPVGGQLHYSGGIQQSGAHLQHHGWSGRGRVSSADHRQNGKVIRLEGV